MPETTTPPAVRLVALLAAVLAAPAAAQGISRDGRPPFPDSLLTPDGPPVSVVLSLDRYALPGPAADVPGPGVWVTAVTRGGARLDVCSSVTERRTGGAWVPVDTTDCELDRPPAPGPVVAQRVHLNPDLLARLVADAGPGMFRVVYAVADADGRPLPDSLGTTPPFAVVDFAAAHPRAVVEFEGRPGWRALAVGRRADSVYFWGYSYCYPTAEAAANRALAECRGRSDRDGDSACWVERVERAGRTEGGR